MGREGSQHRLADTVQYRRKLAKHVLVVEAKDAVTRGLKPSRPLIVPGNTVGLTVLGAV